ncbi:MAG TPA: YceI family protein, partial [Burkholderiales bacterium]|nr:YceI family protein [Burkholderiales bacterium]
AAVTAACAVLPPSSDVPLPSVSGGGALYVIDPAHTFPHFEVTHMNLSTHHGRFNRTSGWIMLDRAARRGAIELVIDAASVDTGDPALEQRLRGEDFFDSGNFPQIKFRADKFRFDDDKPIGIDGELTLRGVTRPVTLAVSAFRCGQLPLIRREACGAQAETTIKRADFGMSIYPSMIGADVRLLIQVEGHKR